LNKLFFNVNNLKDNINKIKELTNKEIIAVIKSNAYGLNSYYMYKILNRLGINFFVLYDIDEFKRIENIVNTPILILNNHLRYYDNKYIRYTINSVSDALYYKSLNKKIIVHLQIDTGMNRDGIRTLDEYLEILDIIKNCHNITIEGIFTHFASNYLEQSYYNLQCSRFSEYLKYYDYKIIHTAASNSLTKKIIGNYVRIGIQMYGLCKNIDLKEVFYIRTSVINTFFLKKEEPFGYGLTKLSKSSYISVIPIGYNNINDFDEVYYYLNNKRYKLKIIGVSCMNHRHVHSNFRLNKLSYLYIFLKNDKIDIDYYRMLISIKDIKKYYIEVKNDLSKIIKRTNEKSFVFRKRRYSHQIISFRIIW
jgi:alanine racemase